jgi:hypothetical protein
MACHQVDLASVKNECEHNKEVEFDLSLIRFIHHYLGEVKVLLIQSIPVGVTAYC